MLMARVALRRSPTRQFARRWHDVATPGRLGDPSASNELPLPIRSYLGLLHKRPMAGAATGAAIAAAIGDVLAQAVQASGLASVVDGCVTHHDPYSAMADLSSRPQLIDGASTELGVLRTARFAATVGALVGCAGELWFRHLLGPFPGWTYDVALRTIVDQAVFAPIVLALTIGSVTVAATGDVGYARQRVRQDTMDPLGQMWTLWGCGLALSYLAVPTPWQPPFAMALGVAWSAIVSTRLHRPVAPEGSDAPRKAAYLRENREFERAVEPQQRPRERETQAQQSPAPGPTSSSAACR